MLGTLNADVARHNAAVAALAAEITAHNNRAANVDTANGAAVSAYNAAQTALMARRAQLEQEEASFDHRQNEYQAKVQEYNNLAIRTETLTNSMDSLKSASDVEK
jgi:Skp family chaperone for outer membrane proteins